MNDKRTSELTKEQAEEHEPGPAYRQDCKVKATDQTSAQAGWLPRCGSAWHHQSTPTALPSCLEGVLLATRTGRERLPVLKGHGTLCEVREVAR